MIYTPEFRVEAVRDVLSSSRPVREVAERLGIRPDTLRGWITKARKEASMTEEREESASETEIKELKKRLREAEEENRFLKKAAAFFASEQRPQNGLR
ncbi:MAG: transposase [Acidimicrobiales bacterium]